jgi:hypothetical protein
VGTSTCGIKHNANVTLHGQLLITHLLLSSWRHDLTNKACWKEKRAAAQGRLCPGLQEIEYPP